MMKKLALLLLLFSIAVVCLCGCEVTETLFGEGITDEEFLARNEDADEAVVVILGNHANGIRPSGEQLQEALDPVLEKAITYSISRDKTYCARINLSVVVCDGSPQIATLLKNEKHEVKLKLDAESAELLDLDINDAIMDIYKSFANDNLKAKQPQSDLHAAMVKARNILRENPGKKNHIFIFDNGMVTAGYLNMNAIDIQGDTPENVVKSLPDASIVNMEGIYVKFIGLANTCGAQIDIRTDSTVCDSFIGFWESYLKACNPENEIFLTVSEMVGTEMAYIENKEDSVFPWVDNVSFSMSPMPTRAQESETGTDDETPDIENLVFNSTTLGFEIESDVFRDPEMAVETINSYAETFEILKQHPEIIVYVVGSTAQIDPDVVTVDSDLSVRRATAVKNLILSIYDFPEERLQIVNAGCQKFTWRDAEEFPDGTKKSLDEVAQQKNRVVALIFSTNTDEVQELIDKKEIPAP